MTAWRIAVGSLLSLLVGLPLAWPLLGLFDARVAALARNTGVLVSLTLALAVPPGVLLAVLLERTDLPLRRTAWALLILSLFVPLPLLLSGWQAVLGGGLWYAAGGWAPWAAGIGPAARVHAAAGLPWVALLVARGLAGVERGLEEDELLLRGPAAVLWRVSLPRAGAAVAAAALWVAVQTATEITVTDLMQVRTFAEEVYTQFVAPEPDRANPDPLGRAVAVSLFGTVPFVALVLLLARHAERALPAGDVAYRPAVQVGLGAWRWPAALAVLAAAVALLAVPAGGLIWRAGLAGTPPAWSPGESDAPAVLRLPQRRGADRPIAPRRRRRGGAVRRAGAAGLLAGAREPCFRRAPADAAGRRLGDAGAGRRAGAEGRLRSDARSDGERPAGPPAGVGRPLAAAARVGVHRAAAAVRGGDHLADGAPRAAALSEAARLDGAGVAGELTAVAWPAARRAALTAAAAVAVLSLGELAAGKLVSTPGAEGYAEALFSQMHYGVGPDLAARSLWLVIAAALGAAGVGRLAR